MQRLRKRQDFLAARDGRKSHAATLSLQARRRAEGETGTAEPRAGFTVTKKTGGSVERNRIRRRLREALKLVAPDSGQNGPAQHGPAHAGHDYVVIGRTPALNAPFATLCNDLANAFGRVHAAKQHHGRRDRSGGSEAPR